MKRLPMPASGNLDRNQLRGVDVKLVSNRVHGTIVSNQWLQKRRPYWERLAGLLAQAGAGGVRQLTRAELHETALLYRQVASDLSTLRQDSTARAYTEHVNQLLARAHHIIYSSRRTGFLKILRFLRDEYPAIVQRQIRYVLLSLVITLAVRRWARYSHWRVRNSCARCSARRWWPPSSATRCGRIPLSPLRPWPASAIMTNNLSVCFIAFAGGIVFGLGPVYSMFFNGLLLGVIGAACQQHGMSIDLWSFVAPHGALELPSIVLAGAAGLRLGRGVVFPGIYRWRDSVTLAGVEATRIVSGIIPLLIIAGTLEGFFSPSKAAGLAQIHRRGLAFLAAAGLAVPAAKGGERNRAIAARSSPTPSPVPSPSNTGSTRPK